MRRRFEFRVMDDVDQVDMSEEKMLQIFERFLTESLLRVPNLVERHTALERLGVRIMELTQKAEDAMMHRTVKR